MSDIAGSIRKLTLDGVSYDVFSDADVSEVGSRFENTALTTSGRTILKQSKRVETRDSVVVACNAAEREQLRSLADRGTEFSMSYETADKAVYRAVGFINFNNRTTQEMRAELQLIPVGEWEAFLP